MWNMAMVLVSKMSFRERMSCSRIFMFTRKVLFDSLLILVDGVRLSIYNGNNQTMSNIIMPQVLVFVPHSHSLVTCENMSVLDTPSVSDRGKREWVLLSPCKCETVLCTKGRLVLWNGHMKGITGNIPCCDILPYLPCPVFFLSLYIICSRPIPWLRTFSLVYKE